MTDPASAVPIRRFLRPAAILAVLLAAAGSVWWIFGRHGPATELTLYGNVDLREVDLPFNDSERVAAVLVQEGDHVRRGQVLARLDTSRLRPQVDRALAQVEAQQQVVDRLRRGTRPEEIAEARAAAAAAAAAAADAHARYARLETLSASSAGRAVSRQDLDAARFARDAAAARLDGARSALALAIAGPRKEDVAQAEAVLSADRAQLVLLRTQFADAELRAPLDAVVRSRIVEPGEMSSPQKTAFTLAITDPKWIRAYVAETDLGKVREGERASVSVDAFPGRRFAGWVGFISPVAEFTPKSVETSELRTSLVYEIRVFVKDHRDDLRLGMPATVHIALTGTGR